MLYLCNHLLIVDACIILLHTCLSLRTWFVQILIHRHEDKKILSSFENFQMFASLKPFRKIFSFVQLFTHHLQSPQPVPPLCAAPFYFHQACSRCCLHSLSYLLCLLLLIWHVFICLFKTSHTLVLFLPATCRVMNGRPPIRVLFSVLKNRITGRR